MATIPKSEYVGFTVNATSRDYTLRVSKPDGGFRRFVVSIAKRAFLVHHIGYQDGPAICFLKLERELESRGDANTASKLRVSDAELLEFRDAREKRSSSLRPRPNIKP